MTPDDGKTCARIIRNSCINPLDVQTARAAKWGMHREWCASLPAGIGAPMKARLQRLYDFIESGLLKVKVLPDEAFGLIHGKADVTTRTDGSQVCFRGKRLPWSKSIPTSGGRKPFETARYYCLTSKISIPITPCRHP